MPTTKFNRPLVVVNPVSGNGRAMRRFERDQGVLFEQYPELSVYTTQCPGDVNAIEQAILHANPDLLIVFGGDGTLNDVVNGSDAKIPIALVPSGSGNDFATLLGIKRKTNVMARLSKVRLRKCDLGKCNGQWSVNGLGIGFDGEIARRTVSNSSSMPPWIKYYMAILRSLLFYKESESIVEWDDGGAVTSSFLMITLANGRRYGGSFRVAPRSKPDDGWLDLVLIEKVHPILRPIYLPLVILGKHLPLSFVQHHLVSKVNIRAHDTLPAHTDGELMLSDQFEVAIYPKRLDFLL